MTFEKFKTITLNVLVLLSLLLTYKMWTFQPNYEQLGNLETIEKVTLGPERPLSEVVLPIHVLYHNDGKHMGAYSENDYNSVYELFLGGEYRGLDVHSLNLKQLNNIIEKEKSIEFVYPDGFSMEIFNQLLDFEDPNTSLTDVERVVIFEQLENNRIQTYAWFISFDGKNYLEAQVTNQTFAAYEDLYNQQKNSFLEVEPMDVNHDRPKLYFPVKAIQANKYQAYPSPISEPDLTKALFQDSNVVRASNFEKGIRSYTDGNRELKLYVNSNYLTYINPSRRGERFITQDSPLLQAHRFVNQHGGFMDPYMLANINKYPDQKTEIDFQLLFNGYPAFDARIAELEVVWQDDEVFEYQRSMETISDSVVYEEPDLMTLMSASELETLFKESELYNVNDIENVTLGYTINEYDGYIVFTPNWYIHYQGKWEVLLKEDSQ